MLERARDQIVLAANQVFCHSAKRHADPSGEPVAGFFVLNVQRILSVIERELDLRDESAAYTMRIRGIALWQMSYPASSSPQTTSPSLSSNEIIYKF
jgi:hypothetical protein